MSRLPRRVAVVGSSGAGKTTVARVIAQELGLPRLELDELYHQPNWKPLDSDEFKGCVTDFLARHDSWVIDGNYLEVVDLIWSRATTVIWLEPPRWRVMLQLVRRTLGRVLFRTELWNGNREPLSNLYSIKPEDSVLAWAWVRYASLARELEARASDPRWEHLSICRCAGRHDVSAWLADECAQ